MNIEFFAGAQIRPGEISAEVRSKIRELLRLHAESAGVPPDAIAKIVIVEAANYGAAIQSIAAGECWTDNAIATGMAKTISIGETGKTQSVVVMWAELFADLPGIPLGLGSLPDRDRGLMRRYIVCHELGHCKDNWLRGTVACPPLSVNGEFGVKSVAAYYHYILLSEFAACAHSSKALDPDTLTWEWNHTDIIPGVLAALREKRRTFDGDPRGVRDLAFMASEACWTMLIQFAKLVGSRIAHPELMAVVPRDWAANGRIAEGVFEREASILEELWQLYPSWDNAMSGELSDLWRLVAENEGYRFAENAGGDAMFLR